MGGALPDSDFFLVEWVVWMIGRIGQIGLSWLI
jgi:hypothetical protein